MTGKIASRKSLISILKAGTIAGVAAAVVATGAPQMMISAFAAPVEVKQANQVPSFADVVSAVTPAVVSVRVSSRATPASNDDEDGFFGNPDFNQLPDNHPFKRFFKEFGQNQQGQQGDDDHWKKFGSNGKPRLRPTSQGSGFFISEDGYLVTNNHVVEGGAAYTVLLSDGTELDAKLIGHDPRTDLAVLKVNTNRKFTYVQWADDSKVRVGDWVVAVGNPFGLGGTVTAGIVSARSRDLGGAYDDYIQVDAAVNRGNSGGPSFNLNGEVIGINTAIFSPNGANAGIAFAIPASVAKDVVAKLMKGGDIHRGWLGVKIEPVTQDVADSLGLPEATGALVNEPQAGSPGEKAGIKVGDVITSVDGQAVKGPKELARMIGSMDPGKTVDVTLWRGGKSMNVKLTLGTLPDENQMADAQSGQNAPDDQQQSQQPDDSQVAKTLDQLGLEVQPSDDGHGVQVTSVDPNSDAADKGVKPGQKITSVNNQDVNSARDIQRLVQAARKDGRKKALFQLEDQTGNRFVALPIG